jgi:L-alanine-DL-glutamate epimerase-like enolase superfamily enzyme
VPTESEETDGTLAWDATTLVAVWILGGGLEGFGYSYAAAGAADLIADQLAPHLIGRDAMAPEARHAEMTARVRNLGQCGLAMMAVAAADIALWDLKARLLGLPLVTLLGQARDAAPGYGSGGFTSLDAAAVARQLGNWRDEGFLAVKMKIGRDAAADRRRVEAARRAVGDSTDLLVDANGAYTLSQALATAAWLREFEVSWFEEPVPAGDLAGLRGVRGRVPPGMEISVGEYGYTARDFRALLEAGACDVLQADVTRCGITGFRQAAALCEAYGVAMSSHCAPALHVHPACAARPLRHMEYFHDHVRIESELLEGAVRPQDGVLRPDLSRLGHGLALNRSAAARYEVRSPRGAQ